ncbi:hypothetical protein DDB_G0267670 [Dictyostelium discoideum AX4]|uniref:Nucleolar protein 16 n=1 Tax=Dictyostelium discoideum TaxID=44689 RepID=Q55GH7_DICDI|nr:hypothetical protein DDB_G0267670 [Dictyostelium discoideum AX4]EAL73288.1 hypothetical protein DDB_G0267670 [Dictyostelium discoideum AX4]|eukprot:XP_647207.1 hypothetical protein DDB_G0267670 [Dictyostelium discoideum AX4]
MTGMNNKIDRKRRKEGTLKKQFNFGRVDEEVMKRWDNNKTALENFALMGLQYSNKFECDNKKALNKLGMEAKPVDLTLPKEVKAKDRGINAHLQQYTKALIIKYKDDYEKMKMDHKLNFYQKTAGELEKLCNKYTVLYGHPLMGDVYKQQQQQKEKEEKEEQERLEKEKQRLEQEKLEKERLEKEKLEKAAAAAQKKTTTPTAASTKKVVSKKATTTTTPTTEATEVKKVVKKTPTTTTKKISKK